MIYYGDEIGMGDNIYLGDRDGVRTPMQWSADRNAGFSMAPPQQLYLPLVVDFEYHHATVHVEAQEQDSHSLLAFMKRLLGLRRRYRAFGRGDIRFLNPANHKVLVFIREYEESILVVANLSRFGQAVELDLAGYAGTTLVELFGRTPFWPVTDEPYRLTIGPHAFFWFALVKDGVPAAGAVTAGWCRRNWRQRVRGACCSRNTTGGYLRRPCWDTSQTSRGSGARRNPCCRYP